MYTCSRVFSSYATRQACIQELVNLSEWDAMLSDLEEMGFANRELNTKLLGENNGSLKKTVKSLVGA